MNVIDPRGMDIREWVDSTADNLSSLVRVMRIDRGEQWKEWGEYVRQSLMRSGILTPDPQQFEFEEWGSRFNQVISTL